MDSNTTAAAGDTKKCSQIPSWQLFSNDNKLVYFVLDSHSSTVDHFLGENAFCSDDMGITFTVVFLKKTGSKGERKKQIKKSFRPGIKWRERPQHVGAKWVKCSWFVSSWHLNPRLWSRSICFVVRQMSSECRGVKEHTHNSRRTKKDHVHPSGCPRKGVMTPTYHGEVEDVRAENR